MSPVLASVSRHKIIWIAAAVVVVAALVLGLTRPWSARGSDRPIADPAPGDRVLQTVDLTMAADGALTQVGDTVVVSRGQTGAVDTTTATYQPAQVIDQLPVRVLTAYRTDTAAGTNLADLKGHTGKITIDLTVENLTAKPQRLTYDSAGRSLTSTAVVGVPLTVVASAALPKTSAATVITSAEAADGAAATNGVISRTADETTQVQWATILAPPQLAATATLRLVVDAKDFTLPAIDLSVQPGLVTDPSIGALVQSAFNPRSGDEVALQARTIALVGDVNAVVTRAGDTVTKVRSTLSTTSKTLGTKTVDSLRRETQSINSTLRSSSSDITSLGRSLDRSLKATNSATVAALAKTVDQLDAVLGDPNVKVATPVVRGCDQTLAAPKKGSTVWESLALVSAQLDAYATATAACKEQLSTLITSTVGPEKPETCTPQDTSLVCSLRSVNTDLGAVANEFLLAANAAVNAFNADLDLDLSKPLGEVSDALAALTNESDDLPNGSLVRADELRAAVGRALASTDRAVDELALAVRTEAEAGKQQSAAMTTQNQTLAAELCGLIGAAGEPNKLSLEQVNRLRAYLTTQPCSGIDGSTPTALPGVTALDELVAAQSARFDTLSGFVSTVDDDSALRAVKTQLAAAQESLQQGGANGQELRAVLAGVVTRVNTLAGRAGTAENGFTEARQRLIAALTSAQATADAKAKALADPAKIERIVDDAKANREQIEKVFDRAASGLSSAADTVRSTGADAVQEQRQQLDEAQEDAEETLNESAENALSSVSAGVSSSARDLEATRTMLSRDLTNILLDLGTPGKRGTGVLGLLATGTSAAGSADYQLALASDKVSAYGAVRARDLDGLNLRQAQAEASLQRQTELPAFVRPLADTVQHRTVYVFHLAGEQ